MSCTFTEVVISKGTGLGATKVVERQGSITVTISVPEIVYDEKLVTIALRVTVKLPIYSYSWLEIVN